MSKLLIAMNPLTVETGTHIITTNTAYWFDFEKCIKKEITVAEYENGTRRKYTSKVHFNSREDLTIEYFRVKEIKENL